MAVLALVAALICAGAVITRIGTRLIEHTHPPRGRFVDVGGSRQHVVELGCGADAGSVTAVVLIHGAGCNLEDMYLALGERLAARYRVILVDRPGLGWSERGAGEAASPAEQAAVLRGLLDRLGVNRAIVVGHSWGGTLALTFALDHPQRVSGLVLIAPPTHPRLPPTVKLNAVFATPAGWLLAHTLAFPFGALLIGAGFRGAFLPEAPPHGYLRRAAARLLLRPHTLRANAADVAGLEVFLAQQIGRYPTLATPTVIITGDRDMVVAPQHHAMKLAAAAPGARLRVLPGCGHLLHHGAADRVIAAVAELARETGGHGAPTDETMESGG